MEPTAVAQGAANVGPVAVVTGGSQGLGLALARSLVDTDWSVVIDARDGARLAVALDELNRLAAGRVVAIPGDIADPRHVEDVVAAARRLGPVRLIVNNASTLGASPLPTLVDLEPEVLARILAVNVVAPLALVRALASELGPGATIVNITSDAGAEAYPTWGGYGASKAALEHASRVLAAERPEWRVLVVDPGDLRTQMHQDAFPGEDLSDLPEPEIRVPALVGLLESDAPSGRYRLEDLPASAVGP
jgi:NAD(P)-dependent dehydrogenase (short-subunit alcohol dehydrogenase family)